MASPQSQDAPSSFPISLNEVKVYPFSRLQNTDSAKLAKLIERKGILCFKHLPAMGKKTLPNSLEQWAKLVYPEQAKEISWVAKMAPALIISRSYAIKMARNLVGINISESLQETPEEYWEKMLEKRSSDQLSLAFPAYELLPSRREQQPCVPLSVLKKGTKILWGKNQIVSQKAYFSEKALSCVLTYRGNDLAIFYPPSLHSADLLLLLVGKRIRDWSDFLSVAELKPQRCRNKLKTGEESEILEEYVNGVEALEVANERNLPKEKIEKLFKRFGKRKRLREQRVKEQLRRSGFLKMHLKGGNINEIRNNVFS